MAYKIQHLLDGPLEQIQALPPHTSLDVSEYTLEVCNHLVSTHGSEGWRVMNPLRARQSKLINDSVVEVENPNDIHNRLVDICPSLITSGMFIFQHGYIGKVVKVDRYESDNKVDEPFVYVVRMAYVSGDLSMHWYFLDSINNGCNKGHLSSQQGNRLTSFSRVVDA